MRADMARGGVSVLDAVTLQEAVFIATGPGAHGIYPSRDGTKLYVANRGSSLMPPAKVTSTL